MKKLVLSIDLNASIGVSLESDSEESEKHFDFRTQLQFKNVEIAGTLWSL